MTSENSKPNFIKIPLMICPKCSYNWYSQSKVNWITCPNCHHKWNVNKKNK